MKRVNSHCNEENESINIASTAPISSSTTHESFENCLLWLKSHKTAGLDDVSFRHSNNCSSYGCYANKDYNVNDIIFEIPQDCLYSLQNIFNTVLTDVIIQTSQRLSIEKIITPEFIFWLHMIEQSSNITLPFHSYFSSLSLSAPNIENWSTNCEEFLEGTNLGAAMNQNSFSGNEDNDEKISNLLNEIWISYQLALQHPLHTTLYQSMNWNENIFTLTTLNWARGQYLSRRYPEKFINIDEKALQFRNNLPLHTDLYFGQMGLLAPLLDILNHNDEREWLSFKIEKNNLQVICNYPVKMGEELYSNYGDLSNERLLYAYGFALENNKHDTVALKLNIELDETIPNEESNVPSSAPSSSSSSSSRSQNVFYLQSGGMSGVPQDMWHLLASLYQSETTPADTHHHHHENKENDQTIENSSSSSPSPSTPVEIGIEECELLFSFIQNKLMKIQNNQQSLEELIVEEMNQSPPPKTMKTTEDDQQIARKIQSNPHLQYLKYYRNGQIQILQELLQDLEEVIQQQETEDLDCDCLCKEGGQSDEEEEEDEEDM